MLPLVLVRNKGLVRIGFLVEIEVGVVEGSGVIDEVGDLLVDGISLGGFNPEVVLGLVVIGGASDGGKGLGVEVVLFQEFWGEIVGVDIWRVVEIVGVAEKGGIGGGRPVELGEVGGGFDGLVVGVGLMEEGGGSFKFGWRFFSLFVDVHRLVIEEHLLIFIITVKDEFIHG